VSEAARQRFEFGRHETFPVREAWLAKGLQRMEAAQAFRADLETADALGLGSRMVKSLAFWLEAAGLAERVTGQGRVREGRPTALAETISVHDPFLELPASWWFVHLMLARRAGTVWHWFFNDYAERAFDRRDCVDAFARHVRDRATNGTTLAVMQRDVACLLASYAVPSGGERPDPEDATVSPLRALGLLVRHTDTGRFERTRPLDRVPVEAVLAAASLMVADTERDAIPLADLGGARNGPGRIMGLPGEAIDAVASEAAEFHWMHGVRVDLLGASRVLTVPRWAPEDWLAIHFRRIGIAS